MKYHTIIFGCQMNVSDAERISAILESIKYEKTLHIDNADLIIITMCSVRQSAVDRVRGISDKFINLRKNNPNLKTILTGCVLKKDRKMFLNYFDYVVDIKDIKKLPSILGKKITKNIDNYLDIAPKHTSKFSATIPIMTGCNNFCSYCVVPYAREREVSRSSKKIISEIKKLIKNDYKEIWLLGQNVNSYKDPSTSSGQVINFPKLLKTINEIPGNFWIRFTSSHPKDFNGEVIDAMAEGRHITPYLNLPIQSGDNNVLVSMNRHYTVRDYKNKIKELRKKIPGICLSTDIIVGFPGETKKQFSNTVKLFKDVKYDMAYINKYSTRYGTAAAKLEDNVSIEEKKKREKILNETLTKTALKNNNKIIGSKSIVLIDNNKNGYWFGKNEHYKTVKINQKCSPKKKNLIGSFVEVKITGAMAWSLIGEII